MVRGQKSQIYEVAHRGSVVTDPDTGKTKISAFPLKGAPDADREMRLSKFEAVKWEHDVSILRQVPAIIVDALTIEYIANEKIDSQVFVERVFHFDVRGGFLIAVDR